MDRISGLDINILFGLNTYDTLTMKVKLEEKNVFLEVTDDSTQVIEFYHNRAIAILDIRLVAYYEIQQVFVQQRFRKYYSSESTQNIFEYSNFRNKLQEQITKSVDPYPWLEPNDPRRKMTDKILRLQSI